MTQQRAQRNSASRHLLVLLIFLNIFAPPLCAAAQQSREDFAAVDQFWQIHDLLVRDIEPTETQWAALLTTPAYVIVERNLGPVIRDDLEVAFKPSRIAERQAILISAGGRRGRIEHLRAAEEQRPQLVALEDSLVKTTPVSDALSLTLRYLPPEAAQLNAQPPVTFALFADDAFSTPSGIVVDLMNAHGGVLLPILAHEFHHSFVYRLSPGAPKDLRNLSVADLLYFVRLEGIADQIDKPYPFTAWAPALKPYTTRYNSEYERAPQTIHALDSLLRQLASDSSAEPNIRGQIRSILWSSGHPVGAYMARTVIEAFGRDSLMPGTRNPAAFLRTYASAVRRRGDEDPFSSESWKAISWLERTNWR